MKTLKYKKICVVTGSRSEYGLLKKLLKKIKKDKYFKLQLIVTGSHLSNQFGFTYNEILDDGFKASRKVDLKLGKDTSVNISNSMSIGLKNFTKNLQNLKPHLVLLLGDRYEIFIAAVAACICRIPIAHIHGGESTEGAIDESLRHSITKMAHIHFSATEKYKRRIIQMGENPKKVFNVGGLGVSSIKSLNFINKKKLEKELDIKFQDKNILVGYHPETINKFSSKKNLSEILKALKKLKNTTIIFTMPNADMDSKIIYNLMKKFVHKNNNSYLFKSLGQKKYYSCCKYVDLIIGNSSSGILEMPSFKKGTINIGDRQRGRLKAKTVIDVQPNSKKILKAISYIYSKKFKKISTKSKNPYDNGNTSGKIIKILKKIKLENILIKKFVNLKFKASL